MTSHQQSTLKCPCCNNPWAAATGDIFAKLCQTCNNNNNNTKEEEKEQKTTITPAIDVSNLDTTIHPSTNFYMYSNGNWMKQNPIPAGYPNWNTFLQLHTNSQERLRDLLTSLKTNDSSTGTTTTTNHGDDGQGIVGTEDIKKLTLFFNAAMDENKIELDGLESMKDMLQLCDDASNNSVISNNSKTTTELATLLGKLVSKYGISAFFSIGASPDNKNSNHSLCQIAQGGLGLPDRDYYFDDDKEDKRIAYKKHIANMLFLLENPTATLTCTTTENDDNSSTMEQNAHAYAIFDLETKLAEAHMTKTENRDPEATYNKMTLEEFTTSTCSNQFDFQSFFVAATGKSTEELGPINIRNVAALQRASELISNINPTVLQYYLKWRVIRSCAPYLGKAFVQEDFEFNEQILAGTKELKPRWKRAMQFTEKALGEILGQLYCAKYFDVSCKDKALYIVESVRKALEERLMEVDWIKSETTRNAALLKMSRFNVKIGYPDKWIDYSPLVIGSDDTFLTMVLKSRAFDHSREVKEMNAPTDKDKWFMTPQTVNAYYHPSLNEIVFPAAILQPPFFNVDADDAVNFGAMGAVVGHEMTHGFDDKGRKFNADGNMIDWWTKEDAEEYEKRVEVMVQQANAVEIFGQNVQGKLTCGENIADLGGLRLALRALKSQKGFSNEKDVINGFTPIQRFFLGWAQCWRQNITKERALQLLTIDPHGPNEMRCNGALSNIEDFISSFDIPQGTPMFKERENRVDIW